MSWRQGSKAMQKTMNPFFTGHPYLTAQPCSITLSRCDMKDESDYSGGLMTCFALVVLVSFLAGAESTKCARPLSHHAATSSFRCDSVRITSARIILHSHVSSYNTPFTHQFV